MGTKYEAEGSTSVVKDAYPAQAEKKARNNDVMDLRRWLDDAQGQLQNTQTALTLKEAECKDILQGVQARNGHLSTQ